jgi:nucleoside-diphosphate-sugar epimerase
MPIQPKKGLLNKVIKNCLGQICPLQNKHMQTSNKQSVLVTGGSGFVALHCIQQLLTKGYEVKTTLRSLSRKQEVIHSLEQNGTPGLQYLSFVEADLTKDDNWLMAASGCDYVLHIASPIFLKAPKDEQDMLRPAVEGTLRVLRAAKAAGVRRVVITSNFGAVGYSHKDKSKPITEESWTNPDEKGLSAYNKSKVLAEKAAWDFIKKEGGQMELTVVNPVGIFGPALNKNLSSGFELLKQVLNGSMRHIPDMTMNIVDVRDLADLEIRAMTSEAAGGQRFLALSDGIWSLPQMAKLFKAHFKEQAPRISTRRLPDWMVRIAALFNPTAKNLASMLGIYRNTSNEKARRVLGWQPRPAEEALLETVKSLIKFGNI